MKAFVIAATAAFVLISSAAQATVLTITGAPAEYMMQEMLKDQKTVYVLNTVETTVIQNGDTECTLLGSHGGSVHANQPIYSCQITQ